MGRRGNIIACTQPRRVAATSVAGRVASEVGSILGDEVDEAHERSIYTDLLLGLLKKCVQISVFETRTSTYVTRIQKKRPSLRLVISSATLDATSFLNYFTSSSSKDDAIIVSLEGRVFPVEVAYLREPTADYVKSAAMTAWNIHLQYNNRRPKHPRRLIPLPLHAGLTSDEQLRVFDTADRDTRKVIIATNIAEASVTIDGIKYVIDSGFVKIRVYNPRTALASLATVPTSRASATQRAGRAGRTAPGPRHRRSHEVRLGLISPSESVLRALEGLVAAGMLGEDGRLTVIGAQVAECPVELGIARMMFKSKDFQCGEEILTIAAITSVQDVFIIRDGAPGALDELERRKFTAEEGLVQVPRPVLPRDVAGCVHPLTAEEVHAAVQPPHPELRRRREAVAAVPGQRVLAQWCAVGRGRHVSVCERQSDTTCASDICDVHPKTSLGMGGVPRDGRDKKDTAFGTWSRPCGQAVSSELNNSGQETWIADKATKGPLGSLLDDIAGQNALCHHLIQHRLQPILTIPLSIRFAHRSPARNLLDHRPLLKVRTPEGDDMRLFHGDAIDRDGDGPPVREVVGAGLAGDVDAAVDGVAVFRRTEVPRERPVLVARGRVVCAQRTAAHDVEVEVEDLAVAVNVAPKTDRAEHAFGSAKVGEIFYHDSGVCDDVDDRGGGDAYAVRSGWFDVLFMHFSPEVHWQLWPSNNGRRVHRRLLPSGHGQLRCPNTAVDPPLFCVIFLCSQVSLHHTFTRSDNRPGVETMDKLKSTRYELIAMLSCPHRPAPTQS
ncbi:ATP-dependent RNA helicase [Salix suchowensis]|nr:ATP-dependent RNA helicase [Salix suchowensis]